MELFVEDKDEDNCNWMWYY